MLGLVAARPVALWPAQMEAARPAVPAGLWRGADLKAQHRAHPSAAAARRARTLQAAEVAQRLAEARQLVAPAVQAAGAAAVRQAQKVALASVGQPTAVPEAAAGWDAVAELQPAAGWDAVAGPQPAAESAGVVARRREAAAVPDGAEEVQPQAAGPVAAEAVRLRAAQAPDAEAAVLPRVARDGVLLLAAAWAALPSTRLQGDRLAPSARARSAHAKGWLRTAQP